MVTVLRTKLQVPPIRPSLVARPQLWRRLQQGLAGRLTLVSAPAGFGKTTVVAQWLAQMAGERPVCWLSLDEEDNEPGRFLAYLAEAVAGLPEVGQAVWAGLKAPPPLPVKGLITAFLQDVTAVAVPFILVLDDYHVIEAPVLDEAIAYLLERAPAHLHLVIMSRTDPTLPLARWRARGQLHEVRQADLRFSLPEATNFLAQTMGVNLSATGVAALTQRTEGWAAGLQLAALSLQNQVNEHQFVADFGGSHRYIMDYLTDEVLAQLPPAVEQFLLQTAILRRFTAPLCEAVLLNKQAEAMLAYLERGNLFLVALDERRAWFRYHHLFGDLLQQRLRRTDMPVRSLHHRAAVWFVQAAQQTEDAAFIEEAIHHAILAKEATFLATLLLDVSEHLWQVGRHGLLQQGLAALPLEARGVGLNVYEAWLLLANGRYAQAKQCLQRVAVQLAESDEVITAVWAGRCLVVQSLAATFAGQVDQAVEYAQEALTYLSAEPSTWRSTAAMVLGDGQSLQGMIGQAVLAYEEAVRWSRLMDNSYLVLVCGVKWVMTLRQQGRLHEALAGCQALLEEAAAASLAQSAMAGCLLTVQGEIMAERDEITAGETMAQQGVTICQAGGHIGLLGWSYLNLARILLLKEDVAGIESILNSFSQQMPPFIAVPFTVLRVWWWWLHGEQERAVTWAKAQTAPVTKAVLRTQMVTYLVGAELLWHSGHRAELPPLLARLQEVAEEGERHSFLAEVRLWQALLAQTEGAVETAVTLMTPVLAWAAAEGAVYTIVTKGEAMRPLLQLMASRGIEAAYARRLLAYGDNTPAIPLPAGMERLSEREVEVLGLIATGLKNKEIAAQLVVSLNTVLYHTKNIYGKLGVRNRTEAVKRAQELGLL